MSKGISCNNNLFNLYFVSSCSCSSSSSSWRSWPTEIVFLLSIMERADAETGTGTEDGKVRQAWSPPPRSHGFSPAGRPLDYQGGQGWPARIASRSLCAGYSFLLVTILLRHSGLHFFVFFVFFSSSVRFCCEIFSFWHVSVLYIFSRVEFSACDVTSFSSAIVFRLDLFLWWTVVLLLMCFILLCNIPKWVFSFFDKFVLLNTSSLLECEFLVAVETNHLEIQSFIFSCTLILW